VMIRVSSPGPIDRVAVRDIKTSAVATSTRWTPLGSEQATSEPVGDQRRRPISSPTSRSTRGSRPFRVREEERQVAGTTYASDPIASTSDATCLAGTARVSVLALIAYLLGLTTLSVGVDAFKTRRVKVPPHPMTERRMTFVTRSVSGQASQA
jgi:hypothetical protein